MRRLQIAPLLRCCMPLLYQVVSIPNTAALARPVHLPTSLSHSSAREAAIDIRMAINDPYSKNDSSRSSSSRWDDTTDNDDNDGHLKGFGAFTNIFIPKGAWIGEYRGELLTLQQVEARYWNKCPQNQADRAWLTSRTVRNMGMSGDYLFEIEDEIYIDGEDADVSNWCRYINHAMASEGECNLETRSWRETWDGEKLVEPRLWFVALRDILAGEELCFDYGNEYWD